MSNQPTPGSAVRHVLFVVAFAVIPSATFTFGQGTTDDPIPEDTCILELILPDV